MTLSRPHEAFALPRPLIRRVPRGIVAWNILIFSVTVALGIVYVINVSGSAARNYSLRNLEKRVEALKTDLTVRQDMLVTESSLRAMSERAAELGFVPVDRIQYVNPASKSYALR